MTRMTRFAHLCFVFALVGGGLGGCDAEGGTGGTVSDTADVSEDELDTEWSNWPPAGRMWVRYQSSIDGGELEPSFTGVEDHHFFKLAPPTGTMTVSPDEGRRLESFAVELDDAVVFEEVWPDTPPDTPMRIRFELDTRTMTEGIHRVRYVVNQDDGSTLSESEEIRVLLNVTSLAEQAARQRHEPGASPHSVLWLGTFEFGLAAYDLGGAPLDPSDDRSLAYGCNGIGFDDLLAENSQDDGRDRIALDSTGQDACTVLSLAVTGERGLWIGGFGTGLTYLDHAGTPFDRSDDRAVRYRISALDRKGSWTVADSVRANSVSSLAVDDDGGLWVGTFQGLLYLDHGGAPLDACEWDWTLFGSDGAYDANISEIVLDDAGLVWISSFDLEDDALDANALTVLDPGKDKTELGDDRWGRFEAFAREAPNKLYTVAIDDQGLKWVGSVDGLFVLDDAGTPFDHSDDDWARWSEDSGLPDNDVATVVPRSDGSLWVGAFDVCGDADDGGGLALLDPSYGPTLPDRDGSPSCPQVDADALRRCAALTPDPARVVVGYTRADGLIDSDVSSVVELDNGEVVLGTFNLLGAPRMSEILHRTADTDVMRCAPAEDMEQNPDLRGPTFVGNDGLSVIDLGDSAADKSDDGLANL